MMRTVNAIGDRLLGLFVPNVTASADPCGNGTYRFCYCTSDYRRFAKFCCSTGGCGSCFHRGYC